MSQTCYVGVNGSGKTHAAVMEIIRSLRNGVNKDGSVKEGRHVYTNIEGMNEEPYFHCLMAETGLCEAELKDRFHWFPDDQIINAAVNAVEGALIVIDECHELICNRKWQSEQNERFAKYGAKHRHFHHDLILITQDIGKIDSHVRSNTNWTFFYRKIDFFGSLVKKGYLTYIYNGQNHEGEPICPPKKSFYRDAVHRCYKSTLNTEIHEMGLTVKVNVLNRPIFWIIPVFIIGFLYYLFNHKSVLSGGIVPKANAATIKQTMKNASTAKLPPGQQVVPPPLPLTNPAAAPSSPFTLCRIFGFVKDADGHTIINVGSYMIKLPSPNIKNVDLSTLTCEIKTSLLEVDKNYSGSRPSPVLPAVIPPSASSPIPSVAPGPLTGISPRAVMSSVVH